MLFFYFNGCKYIFFNLDLMDQFIVWKFGNSNFLVDLEEIECLKWVSNFNLDVEFINEFYMDLNVLSKFGLVWNDIVLVLFRFKFQK